MQNLTNCTLIDVKVLTIDLQVHDGPIDFFLPFGELSKQYVQARKDAGQALKGAKVNSPGTDYTVELWPANLREFIERKLGSKFELRAYILDPEKRQEPTKEGLARPQKLALEAPSLEGDPFAGLLRIDEINAQRAFGDPAALKENAEEGVGRRHSEKRRLSEQLRDYYRRHIDPSESPEATDIDALEAICKAQTEFDKKLRSGFSGPLQEVEGMGYPGFSDPTLVLSTKIHPVDGLNHSSALRVDRDTAADISAERKPPTRFAQFLEMPVPMVVI